MKTRLFLGIALLLATTAGARADSLDIRFCPGGQVRAYPLSDERRLESVLLQNAVIYNRAGAPVTITGIDIQLLSKGVVVDERHFVGAELERLSGVGPAIQGAGFVKAFGFQFCGDALVDPNAALAGPALAPGQGLLVLQQAFAYGGARDALQISVRASQGNAKLSASAAIPIRAEFAANAYRFPLAGASFVGVGPTFHSPHRWALPEEFAFDIAKIGASGLTYEGDGTKFANYFVYGASVMAAADGKVVAVEKQENEDASALRRPGEPQDAYVERLKGAQAARFARGASAIAGNYVLIDHGRGEYALYAHLKPGSVLVKAGDVVSAGRIVGKVGSSGNSTEPHLHFQVCDKPEVMNCAGLPVKFVNVEAPWALAPGALQSGDVVVAR